MLDHRYWLQFIREWVYIYKKHIYLAWFNLWVVSEVPADREPCSIIFTFGLLFFIPFFMHVWTQCLPFVVDGAGDPGDFGYPLGDLGTPKECMQRRES